MGGSLPRKDLYTVSETKINEEDDEEEEEENENPSQLMSVTTHLYLKPAHTTDTLDKNVVLRRIRHHRRRVNKVKSTVLDGFFSSSKATNKASSPHIKWADDAFAAL